MKPRVSRGLLKPSWSKLQIATLTSLLIFFGPLFVTLATLFLAIPPMAFEWSVMGTAPDNSLTHQYFSFWVLLPTIALAPYIALFGAALLVALGLLVFVRVLFWRDSNANSFRKTKFAGGVVCFAFLCSMIAIPKGSDPCSRKLTSTAYDRCLEAEFENVSVSEAKEWLTLNGYDLSSNYTLQQSSIKRTELDLSTARSLKHPVELRFQAYREDQYPEIIPYGTVFNRLFGRIWGAGKRYNLDVYASSTADRVVAVRTDWLISWL